MEWRIDDSTIKAAAHGLTKLEIRVDGTATATIPNSVNGRFRIPWKRREVELRRIGPSSGLESALYVDGALVPPSDRGPIRGARGGCESHGTLSRARCPSCEAVACKRCLSVDGVRCETCLTEAAVATRGKRRKTWWGGAAFCLAVGIACALGAASGENDLLAKLAGTMFFGSLFMVWIGARTDDGEKHLAVDLELELDETPPQLVGGRCRGCKERIRSAADGRWCSGCRRGFHERCEPGHACRPAKRGPDWDAMRAA